jgi:hypothetical protein
MAYLADVVLEDQGYVILVDGWGVTATHGHHDPFPEAEGGKSCSVLDVVGVDMSLEKQICHIIFPPDFAFCAVCQYIVDSGRGKASGTVILLSIQKLMTHLERTERSALRMMKDGDAYREEKGRI